MRRGLILSFSALALAGFVLSRRPRQKYSFARKVILITGGSRGLGLVLARQLCEEGACVALLARDREELEKARIELVQKGGDVLTIPCNLFEREQVASVVSKVVDHFGGIDVLINNAGIIDIGPIDHMRRDDFQRALDLHFWAPLDLIMTAIPHLRRKGEGRIVNIGSIGGRMAVPHLAPYCASKFALTGLSDSLRTELARVQICVTTVTPGLMQTGSHGNARFKGDHFAEYAWFSLATALPFSSIKAERAAARIISASRRGLPSLTIPVAAQATILGSALFPNLVAKMMKVINGMLPSSVGPEGDISRSGWELSHRE